MILLCVVPLILLRAVLQFHSILAGNHDFTERSPNKFAACSPRVIFTVGTTRSKIKVHPHTADLRYGEEDSISPSTHIFAAMKG